MPNSIAYLVLMSWPLVMLFAFRALPPGRALIWTLLAGYLLLPPQPTAFDFPLLPAFNKDSLPNIMALILCITVAGLKIDWLPKSTVGRVLTVVFILSPIATVFNNPEPVLFATGGLRGLYEKDIIALVINQATFLISFTLARQLLRSEEDMRDLLIAMVICGVVYAFPMLLEVRLSPQINIWVYGFFQHLFEQAVRGDGFRPLVFLSHGIWASMLAMMTFSAAVILWRHQKGGIRPRLLAAGGFLFGVLVLTKTLSPFMYAVIMLLTTLFSTWRMQLRIAVLLAALSIAYPLMKGADLVPEEDILALAAQASPEREHSLRFRLENEEILLERAQEKPVFGWGTWGRNHIHDPVSGAIMTVTDGRWVITIGVFGWVGFLAEFGLLALPIFLLWREVGGWDTLSRANKFSAQRNQQTMPIKREKPKKLYEPTPMIGGVALLLALNMVDLLPNATLTPLTWLLAGALFGYAEELQAKRLGVNLGGTRQTALETAAPKAKIAPERPRTVL